MVEDVSFPPLRPNTLQLDTFYAQYVVPCFDLRRALYEAWSNSRMYQPWDPCGRLKGVPLVEGNSLMDPHLGLHILTSVSPPADKTPLDLESTAREGLVRQCLTLFTQVLIFITVNICVFSSESGINFIMFFHN